MPSGYLTTEAIEASVAFISLAYPSITDLIPLPEASVEGRTSRALKIANGSGSNRRGVLLIGGVHARELVNPDLLVDLAIRICHSYENDADISYGGKTWPAATIKLLVDTLDIIIFPLVNPDGRKHVENPSGYAMWRKNRRVNAGSTCLGVDLNRNYDLLWSSGIGTSSSPCSDIYKGESAFSEPETRNVRWLLDSYNNICCLMDVHSYSELILYPWGDDDNQTTDPSQNFGNPVWDGLRGTLGTGYGEYIPSNSQTRFVDVANRIRDAISAVRGRTYSVQQSSDLYPTSGTSGDYAYSRHLVDSTKRGIYGYCLETGTEFQPPTAEANEIIKEGSSGLIQFLASCVCVVEETASSMVSRSSLQHLRDFRDRELLTRGVGRDWVAMLERHSLELLEILEQDEEARDAGAEVTKEFSRLAETVESAKPEEVSSELAERVEFLLKRVEAKASKRMKKDLSIIRDDFEGFRGETLREGVHKAVRKRKTAKKKG